MSRKGRNIVLIVLLTVIQVNSHTQDPADTLLKLISKNEQKPMVVYVNTGKQDTNLIHPITSQATDAGLKKSVFENLLLTSDDGLLDDEDDGQTLEENARDQAKVLLYTFLRTSPDAEDPHLEETKHVLRQALRARCSKVKTCVKKCKPKKPSCPNVCKEVFDEENLCEPPKPKKCGQCGKTLPPRW